MTDTRPDFSIVVPVLYEQHAIAGFLEDLGRIRGYDRCELIVVDGEPDGGTINGISDDRVVTVRSRPGRARQMNAGAAVARGDVLLFLHADTRLPADALAAVERALDGSDAGAFRLTFDSKRLIYRVMAGFVTIRSRWNRLPYGDQALFMRRPFFEELGGYSDIPIMEDVDIVRRIRRAGGRLEILNATVRTSCRRMEAEGLLRRVALNWMMTVLYNLGVSPHKLARFYRDDYRIGRKPDVHHL
jgi:rSAM/selenodomain-associated transferase 2